METLLELVGENKFKGIAPIGASVDISGADSSSDSSISFRPMELLLIALGSCTAVTVVTILGKMRVPFKKYTVKIKGDRADQPPKVFTDIFLIHSFSGSGLSTDKLKRALSLAESYCSAYNMLAKTVKIQNSIQILEE
jgi:putative redox protein